MMDSRFALSLRTVEDLQHARGIAISSEPMRLWWNGFGALFAAKIRKCRVSGMRSCRRQWRSDGAFVRINGDRHYFRRAVDHEGRVLESFVTKTCGQKTALKFVKKTLKRHGSADAIVKDRPRPYGAAFQELGIRDPQETGRRYRGVASLQPKTL